VALGRSRGTRLKHSIRKSTPSGDRSSGIGGGLSTQGLPQKLLNPSFDTFKRASFLEFKTTL
jgi:hypothetical protein